ncbi:TetR/AcrR family transcriptional regulator [Frankia sp. Ag45/Mut15]|uniref:TetR/AcrR family transcriptional regulator n=1 Tax=Frankia umida TaxID=573489 RepID=A0ABT0K4T9_9ACTN|nr:TetR/AcrR family transcriptional regulator [Frankia umida]MCK9878785.1 TetR/AcrR family transcriptional regulator [Frankia umida]
MPRNRQDVPREERIDALLAVAEEQFLARGFAATSIAEIARSAGIEPGSVYWYFRSKDHAFAAVLNRLLDVEVERIAALPGDPAERLFLALDSVERRRTLHPCVAERAPHAEPIMEYHERLHSWLHELALAAVHDFVPAADRALAADAVVATIEGGLANPAPSRPTSHLVHFLLTAFCQDAPLPAKTEFSGWVAPLFARPNLGSENPPHPL